VSLEEHDKVLRELYLSQQKVKKMAEQLKQKSTKQKVMGDQLTVAKEQAEATKDLAALAEEHKKLTGLFKAKKEALKRSGENLVRRESEMTALNEENAHLGGKLQESELGNRSKQVELAGLRKQLGQTMADYKTMRETVEQLTNELNDTDLASQERDSLRLQLADASKIVAKMAGQAEKVDHKLQASGVELHNSAKAMQQLTAELTDVKAQLAQRKADTVALRKQILPLCAPFLPPVAQRRPSRSIYKRHTIIKTQGSLRLRYGARLGATRSRTCTGWSTRRTRRSRSWRTAPARR
jgi:chromosome segregation ATPase